MKIRELQLEDKEKLLELDRLTFSGDELNPENYESFLKNDGFLGLFDPDLKGYLILKVSGSYGHLGRIGVFPIQQGKGYGKSLMEHAISYFKKKEIQKIGLYVESENPKAIPLYMKYGFSKQFESWHYIIQKDQFDRVIDNNFKLRKSKPNDFSAILTTFPHLNRDLLEQYHESENNIPAILLDTKEEIKGFIRFNPKFSGCMPFEVTDQIAADQIIANVINRFLLEDKDYLRITFDRYKWLAEECERRSYLQHHHLYKMEKTIT